MDLLYRSTRDSSVQVTASQAILKGLSADGGLFVPMEIPALNVSLDELAKMIAAASVQNEIDGIINVCTGEPMTLAQRVDRYIKEHHYDIELQYGAYPDRAYDSPGEWGDAAKIRTIMQNANLK